MLNSIKFLLCIWSVYFVPVTICSMHNDWQFEGIGSYRKDFYDDGYTAEHSVLLQWHLHEADALKFLVMAIVQNSSIVCKIDEKLMGIFDGCERVVFTYFDDGYIQESSFTDFKELLVCDDEGYSETIFSVDGNSTKGAYDTSSVGNKKAFRTAGFWKSFVHGFKRRKSAKN